VSDLSDSSTPGPEAPYVPPSAGAELRAAREAAGLTIDEVAQQLKLAPRQVRALEDDDYAKLPGRTFVRGFVRNYARFLELDPDAVLALLPGSDVAPALERPTLTPSGRAMGELPPDAPQRRSWARWLIPLVLIAIVVAAGLYEFKRQQSEARRAGVEKSTSSSAAPAGGPAGASLPNPLASTDASPAVVPSSAAGEPAGAAAAIPASSDAAATPSSAPATAREPSSTTPSQADQPQLVLTFKGTSWVQVKDRNGNTLLAQNGPAGSTQSVSGPLPLDVVIGNAHEVTATFRGEPVDLSPFVRGDVARLSLK
jgi:cytoskeleton protein RodZ